MLSVTGVYSIYIFGLTSNFGFGMRTLIDARFIFNACLSLTIFILANVAIFKVSLFILPMLERYVKPKLMARKQLRLSGNLQTNTYRRSKIIRVLTRVSILLFIFINSIILMLIIFRSFLDFESTLFFAGISVFFASIGFLSCVSFQRNLHESRKNEGLENGFSLRKLFPVRGMLTLAASLPWVVTIALILSLFLGLARFHSLTKGRQLCFETTLGNRRGALIGETENGFFWIDKPLSALSILDTGNEAAYVQYIERSFLVSISLECKV